MGMFTKMRKEAEKRQDKLNSAADRIFKRMHRVDNDPNNQLSKEFEEDERDDQVDQ